MGAARAALAALGLGLGLMPAAYAGVVYDNGAPNRSLGTEMSEFVLAEDFTLASAATIASIRFWSLQSSASEYRGSVYWAIFSDAGTSPGGLLFGGTHLTTAANATGSPSTLPGYLEYSFNIDVADFTLMAGTYWLGLHNGPLADTAPADMLWGATTTPVGLPGQYFDASNGGWIEATGNEHAFLLEDAQVVPPGTVPEPGSLALVALALTAAGVARRKVRSMAVGTTGSVA